MARTSSTLKSTFKGEFRHDNLIDHIYILAKYYKNFKGCKNYGATKDVSTEKWTPDWSQ